MELKYISELRKKTKEKKPNFVRQDFHKKRLKKKWRKPKGLHSKVRLGFKGKPRRISTGFGAPKKVKGLDRSGLKHVLINSLSDVSRIKKEIEGVVIGKGVGLKKRYSIVKKLKELQIAVLNIKDVEKYLKKVEDGLNVRKEKKKKLKEKKEKKKEEKPKKEEKLAEKLTEEEKKDKDKEEKDKILTKKS